MKKVDLLFCGDKKRRLSVCLSTALSYSGLRSRLSVESGGILIRSGGGVNKKR
nr:MAG TPA: hypothetical protein [Bacteriophage sp.]